MTVEGAAAPQRGHGRELPRHCLGEGRWLSGSQQLPRSRSYSGAACAALGRHRARLSARGEQLPVRGAITRCSARDLEIEERGPGRGGAAAADLMPVARNVGLPDAETVPMEAQRGATWHVDLMFGLGGRDRLVAAGARIAFAGTSPEPGCMDSRKGARGELGADQGHDPVWCGGCDLHGGLSWAALQPQPTVAMHEPITVAPDRLLRLDRPSARGADDFGAGGVLNAPVRPEHNILAGLDAHAARCAAREVCHESGSFLRLGSVTPRRWRPRVRRNFLCQRSDERARLAAAESMAPVRRA